MHRRAPDAALFPPAITDDKVWMWTWKDVGRWMKREPKSLPLELVFPSQRFRPVVAIATKPSFRSVSALLSFLLFWGQRCLINHFYCRCCYLLSILAYGRAHELIDLVTSFALLLSLQALAITESVSTGSSV